jgi:hypothetical protein
MSSVDDQEVRARTGRQDPAGHGELDWLDAASVGLGPKERSGRLQLVENRSEQSHPARESARGSNTYDEQGSTHGPMAT